jgi:dTDP-4-amino-4,6-dideoxygalactose transaminase
MLDKLLSKNKKITLVERLKYLKEVFHLYHINVNNRDKLQKYLIKNNIDAKVHYPIPVHLQKAAKYLKYKKGDFPIAEKLANTSLSIPVHEFITEKHIKHIVNSINTFYKK